MLIRIEDSYGLAVLRDCTLACPAASPLGRDRHYSAIDGLAREGKLFFVDGEEAIDLRVGLLVDQEIPSEVASLYQPEGGTFLFHAPSGELAFSGLETWSSSAAASLVHVPPGYYALTVFARDTFDLTAYNSKIRQLAGDAECVFRDRVDRTWFLGCLPTLATAVALVVPPWRRYALYPLALAVLGWLPIVLLTRTNRYRAVEAHREQFEAGLPSYYLKLSPIGDAGPMVGGHVTTR